MFQDRYFVPKSTDTYADVLTAWGLATVLSGVLSQAGVKKSNQVVISDCGAAFCVELPVALEEAWVNAAQREQLTYFILDAAEKTLVKKFETAAKKSKALESANEKNKAAKNREYQSAKSEADLWEQFIINARNSASSRIVDLNLERERSNKRKEWTELNDSRTNDPLLREQWLSLQPHKHIGLLYALRSLNGINPANKVWFEFEKNPISTTLREILTMFSEQYVVAPGVKHSTATILNPSQGDGINNLSPSGAEGGKIEASWLSEWLKTIGFFEAAFCASFMRKKGGRDEVVGVTVAVLTPRRISLRNHHPTKTDFAATFFPKSHAYDATTSSKMECLAAVNYADSFLNYAATETENEDLKGKRIANAVSGFSIAHFMAMGDVFKLKRITFLSMPLWIRIPADGNSEAMREAVEEHIKILRPLDDSRGETRSILNAYLAWSSSGDLRHLWTFTALYGAYRMECAGDKNLRFQPAALSITNLEIILRQQTSNDKPLAPVVSDPHFQAVARAIRKSTINALYQKDNLPSGIEVHYGLAQELRRLSPYKDKFVARLMQHLQTYNEENAKSSTRTINESTKFRRANITTQDIDRLVELIDTFGAETMCGLLLAYGYAKDVRDPDDNQPDSNTQNVPTNP